MDSGPASRVLLSTTGLDTAYSVQTDGGVRCPGASYNSEESPVNAEEGKEVGGRRGALLGVQTVGKRAGLSREGRPPHRGSR